MAFFIAAKVKEKAQVAPAPYSPLGVLLLRSVLTAMIFRLNSTALSISQVTHELLHVCSPTIQRNLGHVEIRWDITLLIGPAAVLLTGAVTDPS